MSIVTTSDGNSQAAYAAAHIQGDQGISAYHSQAAYAAAHINS